MNDSAFAEVCMILTVLKRDFDKVEDPNTFKETWTMKRTLHWKLCAL